MPVGHACYLLFDPGNNRNQYTNFRNRPATLFPLCFFMYAGWPSDRRLHKKFQDRLHHPVYDPVLQSFS